MNTVFKPEAVTKELSKPDVTNASVFSVDLKKTQKVYNTCGSNTTYRDYHIRIGRTKAMAKILWESKDIDKYIELLYGATDPEKSDMERNQRKMNSATIATTVSRAHELGKYADMSDIAFNEIIDSKSRLPVDHPEYIKLYSTAMIQGREVVSIVRAIKTPVNRMYSDSDKTPEQMRGTLREDPMIRYELNFDKYPSTFGKLANQKRSVVRDYKKPLLTPDGKTTYEEARVKNDFGIEEDLCAANAHKFLTSGSKIYRIIIDESTVSIHDKYVSNKTLITELVVDSMGADEMQVVGEDGEVVESVAAAAPSYAEPEPVAAAVQQTAVAASDMSQPTDAFANVALSGLDAAAVSQMLDGM